MKNISNVNKKLKNALKICRPMPIRRLADIRAFGVAVIIRI